MSKLFVRPALAQDNEAIVRIYVESWNTGFGSLMPHIEADQKRTERWRETLAAPGRGRWWVAERDACIVGFAGIGPSRDPDDETLGELDTIAVDPPCWRTGVGRVLMDQALHWLRSDRYRSGLLWTLADYPLGASFYESTGWHRSGETRDAGRQVRYNHELS